MARSRDARCAWRGACAGRGRHRDHVPRRSEATPRPGRRPGPRARHLVLPGARGPRARGVAPLGALRRRDRVGRDRRVSHPDLLRPRPGRGGPHRDAAAGQGLLGLRQRHDPPDRRRLPRGARRRQVRAGRASGPPRRERLRALDARPRLQRLPGRRRHRAGLPEQHRPLRRPLPARALGGRGGGRAPGGGGPPAPRQLPDVLGHREPDRLLGSLVHGHGREPARGGDRPRLRPRDRVWLLARRLLDPDPRRDGSPAARPLQGHLARGDRDAGGAPGRAAGARGAGPAPPAREDRGRHLRGHGRPVGGRGDPRPRLDRGRLPRPRRPARDRGPDPRRHREGRRRARDLHLVRRPLHPQRPAQRARLHGLPGRAAGRGPRRACPRRWPASSSSSPTCCSTTCS